MNRWQTAGFALYVHWPFCQSKCPYCDFNSHVVESLDHERWLRAYITELRRSALETPGRVLSSIFFGGGTPSLMRPEVVAAIIDEATTLWTPANDIEITLEANPTSVEAEKFGGFQTAGVNRVSVGVQALNNADLRQLGRMHSSEEAKAAIRVAQAKFARTSFDLIYARQGQTLRAWRKELTEAIRIAGEHLSLYQLTVEPGTVFGARHARGQLKNLPDEDLSADLYLLTQEICDTNGLYAYEVSNHAIPGAESRHNRIYWKCGDYVGIGPGAHGRITDTAGKRFASVAFHAPGRWLAAVEESGNGEEPRETISAQDQANEFLLMGLRLAEGIHLGEYEALAGRRPRPQDLEDLLGLGLISQREDVVAATLSGRMVLNQVIEALAR